jgi:hypothetical protein
MSRSESPPVSPLSTPSRDGPPPGYVRLTIQDHVAASERPPARVIDVPYTVVPISPDGTIVPPGSTEPIHVIPQ